jgi:hypothetical protein
VQTSADKTQQGNTNKHHQSTKRECQQTPIKHNNGAQTTTNKTQQKDPDEY